MLMIIFETNNSKSILQSNLYALLVSTLETYTIVGIDNIYWPHAVDIL